MTEYQPPLYMPRRLEPQQLAEDIYWVFSLGNAGWVCTNEGVLLVDSASNHRDLPEQIRATTDQPLRYVVYSHGHEDHVIRRERREQYGGDAMTVVGHALVANRLEKYERLRPYINRINSLQFHQEIRHEPHYIAPERTYWESDRLQLGGVTAELAHARGETDDATVVWLPAQRVVFTGDLILAGFFPNVGNPFKVVRFAHEWAEALERILALAPAVLAPGHGPAPVLGAGQVRECLEHNAVALRFVDDEVVRRLNLGQSLDQMVAEVRLPPALEGSRWLQQRYSRLEFAVINTQRRYTGWFDGDPSDVLPARRGEVALALRELIGDDGRLVERARAFAAGGRPYEALELLGLLLRTGAEYAPARRERLRILETLLESDFCMMSRDVWAQFATEDRERLAAGSGGAI